MPRKPYMPTVDFEKWALNLNRDLGAAQDTISHLQAEIDRLREALKRVEELAATEEKSWGYDDDLRKSVGLKTVGQHFADRIRAALGGSNDK